LPHNGHPLALGLRYVSATLKRSGHAVRMIFMMSRRDTASARFPRPLIGALVDLVRDVDRIGVSLMTNTFHRARVLTDALRAAGPQAMVELVGVGLCARRPTSWRTEDITLLLTITYGSKWPTTLSNWPFQVETNAFTFGIMLTPLAPSSIRAICPWGARAVRAIACGGT
jgi:hypothetical protein